MPSAVATALSDGMTDWVEAGQAQFIQMLPLALGLVVTISVAFAAIGWFRGLIHG